MEQLAPILVLGLGNDILTDDAVGLHVVAAVRRALTHLPLVEVKATTEMGLALLDEIAGREGVIIVDSVQTGRFPTGHIHDLGLEDLPTLLTTSPHFLGVRETLALGAMVGLEMPENVRLVAVEVADPFTLGQEMTPAVAAAVPVATELVARRAREMAGALDPS
jgi:hydrogenase maturation protease